METTLDLVAQFNAERAALNLAWAITRQNHAALIASYARADLDEALASDTAERRAKYAQRAANWQLVAAIHSADAALFMARAAAYLPT